jgi:hypothetical protein
MICGGVSWLAAPRTWGVGYRVLKRSEASMYADDFRRIAADQGYGNLMLTPEQQAAFVQELPEVFVPIAGGWGRMGMTHIRLTAAKEEVLAGALRTAWMLQLEKNTRLARRTAPQQSGSG